ncbi:MAG TPA: proprotein convertase P-domain-containing protein, partial [Bacteroidota bacterium]
MKNLFSIVCLSLIVPLSYSQQTVYQPTEIFQSLHNDTSPRLREMPMIPPLDRSKDGNEKEIPNKFDFMRIRPDAGVLDQQAETDPVVQRVGGSISMSVPLVNFEGVGNRQGVYPPDPDGDVGPNHYIQMVNSSFVIYGKSGNILYGPADNSTLWQGFNGPWTGTNDGDPIVLYDALADRWITSQFALPTFPNGPFYELIAVSQTNDPLGAWHRYAFQFPDMPDYPKLGVWPDGYYMSINTFTSGSLAFAGPAAIALERDQMLIGGLAQGIVFQLPTSQGHILPCNLDGPPPPLGAPNYFAGAEDGAVYGGSDRMEVFELAVNWASLGSSTFTGPTVVTTASFDANMCNGSRNCIPQPSTVVRLDALADLMMNRLQYRNFGTHQTLLTNHTVDENSSDHAGIRWYELRKTTGAWSMHQQGTFAPDANHRWVGSVAMNGQGSIALGYSVSSSSVFPSIRYTGRLATDPLGTMTLAEQTIIAGTGSQTGTANRWGDYTSMSVDPTDDQTFWYTDEYIQTTGAAPWQTRVASFQFTDPTPQASISYLSSAISGGNGNGTIDFNECNDLSITLRNTGAATATSITTALSSSTPGVVIAQPVSSYPNIAVSGSSTNLIPFEVNTDPGFVCGTPIVFDLAVDYAGSTTQNLLFVLPSGSSGGAPTQFDNSTVTAIPDANSAGVNVPITVSGFSGIVGKVTASLYINHTWVSDLRIQLISPDQSIVTLVNRRGGNGDNFGTACGSQATRTTLDDAAANPISSGSAPFVGIFRPEEALAAFIGKTGSAVNGVWNLNVADFASQDVGNVNCWSLLISSPLCTDGGGECVPLPVQLSSFSASVQNGTDVRLDWTTLTETNNFGFEVQRKGIGETGFETLPGSFVPGHGTTIEPHSYSFLDVAPPIRQMRYRLKQIDFD